MVSRSGPGAPKELYKVVHWDRDRKYYNFYYFFVQKVKQFIIIFNIWINGGFLPGYRSHPEGRKSHKVEGFTVARSLLLLLP